MVLSLVGRNASGRKVAVLHKPRRPIGLLGVRLPEAHCGYGHACLSFAPARTPSVRQDRGGCEGQRIIRLRHCARFLAATLPFGPGHCQRTDLQERRSGKTGGRRPAHLVIHVRPCGRPSGDFWPSGRDVLPRSEALVPPHATTVMIGVPDGRD